MTSVEIHDSEQGISIFPKIIYQYGNNMLSPRDGKIPKLLIDLSGEKIEIETSLVIHEFKKEGDAIRINAVILERKIIVDPGDWKHMIEEMKNRFGDTKSYT